MRPTAEPRARAGARRPRAKGAAPGGRRTATTPGGSATSSRGLTPSTSAGASAGKAASSAAKGVGKASKAAGAAQILADKDTSIGDKAHQATAAAAEAAASAAATPLVGALVGKAVGSKGGKRLLTTLLVLALIAVFALPAIAGIAMFALTAEMNEDTATLTTEGACGAQVVGVGATGLSAEQSENARTIIEATLGRGLDLRDAVIAIMTAMTESSLRNVNYGDLAGPDSRGLFQQRDPWGPLTVRMDPAGATGLFLDSLTNPSLRVYRTTTLVNATATSRYDVDPWLVAQSVQRSAFADGSNYRSNYEKAAAIVTEMTGTTVEATGSSTCGDAGYGAPGGGSDGVVGGGAWGGHTNGRIPGTELCVIPWAGVQALRCDATDALVQLNAAYTAKFGRPIAITDSYRSYEDQVRLKATKGFLAAKPGTSNHGWGLALDLGGGINNSGSAQHLWMAANAPRFGWVNPNWARPGGSKLEPWHWEFVGTSATT